MFKILLALNESGIAQFAIQASKKKTEWLNICIAGSKNHKIALVVMNRGSFSELRKDMIIVREGRSGWDDYIEVFNSFKVESHSHRLHRTSAQYARTSR